MTAREHTISALTVADRARRRRYLAATGITCLVLLVLGGSLYVVQQGAGRMAELRNAATYDLKEESSRIRAAGEDMALHNTALRNVQENDKNLTSNYSASEAESLLSKAEWLELDSMVLIPAGAFLMGTDMERADEQNRPQHTVKLPAYWIDKYPVTNAQYAKFVVATAHPPPLNWKNGKIPPGELMRPVTMVSWYNATAYAKWAGKRLPTEAEWEKSGRGTDGRRWPWGNKMEPERLNAYYNIGSTSNVNTYPSGASPYGVMDLAGNVNEWTADNLEPYPGSVAHPDVFQGKIIVRSANDKKDVDMVRTAKKYKVIRGGSWKGDPFSTALFHRNFAFPDAASDFFGFRCVRNVGDQDKRK